MRRDDVGLWSPAIGAEGRVIAYGHWGRPLLVFPSQEGRRTDFEDRGMLDAVRGLDPAAGARLRRRRLQRGPGRPGHGLQLWRVSLRQPGAPARRAIPGG